MTTVQFRLPWRMPAVLRRLDTQVSVAVTLVVAFALTAALLIATRVVTDGSLDRASSELAAARSAFYRLEDDRAQFAAAQATLVTALPMFRAHLTDSRVVADLATMQGMAEEYRRQLEAAFCIVTGRGGAWAGSAGWPGGVNPPPSLRQMIAASAAGTSRRGIAEIGDRLFLVVSEPARFASETLGTLTVGYALDDTVAQQLAEVTHCDVNLVVGGRLAASSLTGDRRTMLATLVANGAPLSQDAEAGRAPVQPGAAKGPLQRGREQIRRLGDSEYVAGVFPLAPTGEANVNGRLVLLQDWEPTKRYLAQLRRQLFAAGVAIFALALAGGLLFAGQITRPLRDMASAAGDIASGNWTRRVAVRGTDELTATARAVNEMTTSLRHWYEEAKRRDDELRQTQKLEAIGRLAGGVAHDFNNVLTAIRGYGELALVHLRPHDREMDPVRDELAEIMAAADRAADLTHQLLTFSRRQGVTPCPLALDQLVLATERMLRRIIGEDIELITTFDSHVGRVRADLGQMEQVLLNLVVNARDAMPKGGTLRVSVEGVAVGAPHHDVRHPAVPGRYVCLSVADTGSGMDRETAARIFEPFYTTKEAGRGTGLGLAIVFDIVQDAGGMVDVDTEVGRGTVFRVYLPELAPSPAPESVAAKAAVSAGSAKRSGTVLLVEDDHRLRAIISQTLRNAGYTVLEGSDGEEAFEIARVQAAPIHLLIADVVMPGMNGRVLSDRVTSMRSETRVLFMSGYSDDAVVGYGVETTGASYIRKPFTMDALTNKVRELVRV